MTTEENQQSSPEQPPPSAKLAADDAPAAASPAVAADIPDEAAPAEPAEPSDDARAASSAELRNNSYKKGKASRLIRRGSATLTRTHGSITRTMSKLGSGLRMSKRPSRRSEAATAAATPCSDSDKRQISTASSAPSQVSTDLGGDPDAKLPSWKISNARRNAEPFVPEVQPQSKSGSFIKAKMLGRTVSRVFTKPVKTDADADADADADTDVHANADADADADTHATAAGDADADPGVDATAAPANPNPAATSEKRDSEKEATEGNSSDGVEVDIPVTRGTFALSDAALAQVPKSADALVSAQDEAESTTTQEAVADATETRDAPSISVDVLIPSQSPIEHQLSDTAPLPPPVSRQSSEMVEGPRASTDMTMAPASPTPLVESGSKVSDVFGAMDVSVTHAGHDFGHPLFAVSVTVDGEAKYSRKGDRFNVFRSLAIKLDLIDVEEFPFPKTFLKNKLGVKLTQPEIDKRAADLQRWLSALVEAELPPDVRKALSEFFLQEKGKSSALVKGAKEGPSEGAATEGAGAQRASTRLSQ
eukprot:CAMPEP_0205920904 /NCGR_PEP_ID=MMETSP1325-20131115/11940_1 /ASSEMBLY_ACC=CAM_ASM_000708 /TAXON_ID=236786 /ORGANISM="Florenciella sp., Strain RCC1007" /LENGTH=536 /DNA_ID=CAMNT_0053288643 /DNA_START=7 /DNA_END=1617 /DNA_ORIENTATION=+